MKAQICIVNMVSDRYRQIGDDIFSVKWIMLNCRILLKVSRQSS